MAACNALPQVAHVARGVACSEAALEERDGGIGGNGGKPSPCSGVRAALEGPPGGMIQGRELVGCGYPHLHKL